MSLLFVLLPISRHTITMPHLFHIIQSINSHFLLSNGTGLRFHPPQFDPLRQLLLLSNNPRFNLTLNDINLHFCIFNHFLNFPMIILIIMQIFPQMILLLPLYDLRLGNRLHSTLTIRQRTINRFKQFFNHRSLLH